MVKENEWSENNELFFIWDICIFFSEFLLVILGWVWLETGRMHFKNVVGILTCLGFEESY